MIMKALRFQHQRLEYWIALQGLAKRELEAKRRGVLIGPTLHIDAEKAMRLEPMLYYALLGFDAELKRTYNELLDLKNQALAEKIPRNLVEDAIPVDYPISNLKRSQAWRSRNRKPVNLDTLRLYLQEPLGRNKAIKMSEEQIKKAEEELRDDRAAREAQIVRRYLAHLKIKPTQSTSHRFARR